jgi:hypothetical protein
MLNHYKHIPKPPKPETNQITSDDEEEKEK